MADRIIDFDGTFFRGSRSDFDPSQVPLGHYWNSINAINLGGVVSCRPGHHCLVSFPNGNLQGAGLFRPAIGNEQILVAIDGVIYVAEYPFLDFRILTNVQFSPYAKQVFFTQTTQSAERIDKSFTSAIRVIVPKAVVIMQDGGNSAPAFYDGSSSGHIRDNAFETPAGGPMAWVGDRLWVGKGNQVFASDISNPFSFREQTYLGGNTSFYFAEEVTAMVKTPSIESPQLMVFTQTDGSILEASLRNRDAWPTTEGFQKEVIQIGCASHRGILSHYGRIVWFSPGQGVVFFDPAQSGKITTRVPVRDNEMLVSKTQVSDDVSNVAAGAFGQFLLMSVPAESQYNKHTWVLNHASLETLQDDSGPSWSGYWLGTRPVEWIYGDIAGSERIYHVSADEDGINRLWESFTPDRLDNGCPITWAVETRGYFGQTGQSGKTPGARCRLTWSDVALAGIAEDFDIGVFYAPGVRGGYKPIMAKKVKVAKGSLQAGVKFTAETTLFGFKPQSRVLRTEDANQQSQDLDTGSCGLERKDNENVDESFQLLIVGHGPATLRFVRPFALTVPEDQSGEATACEDELDSNSVRFDGSGAQDITQDETREELEAKPFRLFTANKTRVLEAQGFTAVGVGYAESIVSQAAADRVAFIIATNQAEAELKAMLPPIISAGEVVE